MVDSLPKKIYKNMSVIWTLAFYLIIKIKKKSIYNQRKPNNS